MSHHHSGDNLTITAENESDNARRAYRRALFQ